WVTTLAQFGVGRLVVSLALPNTANLSLIELDVSMTAARMGRVINRTGREADTDKPCDRDGRNGQHTARAPRRKSGKTRASTESLLERGRCNCGVRFVRHSAWPAGAGLQI